MYVCMEEDASLVQQNSSVWKRDSRAFNTGPDNPGDPNQADNGRATPCRDSEHLSPNHTLKAHKHFLYNIL